MRTAPETLFMSPRGHYFRDWLLPLLRSVELREEYRQYRHRGLRTFVGLGGSLLLLLIYLLTLFSTLFFYPEMSRADRSLWVVAASYVAILTTVVVILVQFDVFLRRYDWVVTPFCVAIITKFAVMPELYSHPEAAVAEGFFCMLTILIITLAIRLSLLTVVVILVASLITSSLALAVLVPAENLHWDRLTFYFLCPSIVCLVIALLQDAYQSTNFRLSKLVTQQAQALERLAQEDVLTGLANRRGFDNKLQQEWQSHRRQQQSLALLFMDVDHFKAYNDHYGHEAGDRCLARIGQAIRASLLRASDSAARYGGEEFVVLLADMSETGAREVAQRLLRAVDELRLEHAGIGSGRQVTVSIGVAVTTPQGQDGYQSLLKRADDALYQAKHQGRHRVVVG